MPLRRRQQRAQILAADVERFARLLQRRVDILQADAGHRLGHAMRVGPEKR